MIDRAKVIKGLELCRDGRCLSGCPYNHINVGCRKHLDTDAMELLKEQEAVEPEVEVTNEIDRLYKCPKCHGYLFYDGQKYCDRCGQEVKWNDSD